MSVFFSFARRARSTGTTPGDVFAVPALAMTLAIVATGCSKDAEVQSFITANDAFATELSKRAEKSTEAATAYMSEKKGELKTKFDSIKGARGFQVKKETTDALASSLIASTTAVCGLQFRAITNPKAMAAYQTICEDYTKTFDQAAPTSTASAAAFASSPPAPAGPPPKVDLTAIVGTKKDGWAPKMLAGLKKGMSPQDVGAKFPGAEKMDTFGFSEAHPNVDGIERVRFYFAEEKPGGPGPKKLRSADLYFHPALTTPSFYDELVKATSSKYGKVKADDVSKQLVTWVNPRFETAQLTKTVANQGGEQFQLNVNVPR